MPPPSGCTQCQVVRLLWYKKKTVWNSRLSSSTWKNNPHLSYRLLKAGTSTTVKQVLTENLGFLSFFSFIFDILMKNTCNKSVLPSLLTRSSTELRAVQAKRLLPGRPQFVTPKNKVGHANKAHLCPCIVSRIFDLMLIGRNFLWEGIKALVTIYEQAQVPLHFNVVAAKMINRMTLRGGKCVLLYTKMGNRQRA